MPKTGSQRRDTKLAADLRRLFNEQPQEFARVWSMYMSGWLDEVRRRARAQQQEERSEAVAPIAAVVQRARRLSLAAGLAERVVVARDLATLEHVTCTAIASATDSRLYAFSECATQRARFLFVKKD